MSNKQTTTSNSLYDELKRKAESSRAPAPKEIGEDGMDILALDDTQRTKVLSPARLIAKRFFRNRLALVGLCLLVVMFIFSFLGPLVYPYSQTRIFHKFDLQVTDYASATERTEYILYAIPGGPEIRSTVLNRFNAYIADMKAEDLDEMSVVAADEKEYIVSKLGERIYLFSVNSTHDIGVLYVDAEVATYDRILDEFVWIGESMPTDFQKAIVASAGAGGGSLEYGGSLYTVTRSRNLYIVSLQGSVMELDAASPGSDFQSAVEEHIDGAAFEYAGKTYLVKAAGSGAYTIMERGARIDACIASTYVFNSYNESVSFSDEFKRNSLFALYGSGAFTADGRNYQVNATDSDIIVTDNDGNEVATLSIYAIRSYSGQDTLSLDFKHAAQNVLEDMAARGALTSEFVFGVHEIDQEGNYLYDEDGNPVYADTEIHVTRRNTGEYVMVCEQVTYLIDRYATPNSQNPFGTDTDGMDILARMMYGGRISLLVGFVVVFIEIFIGVILGGVSGFFSGAVDTIVMRIADIFYCIPSYPILIIMGALFDKLKMTPYVRLVWMMVILGVLGWAGVARLVRGQILSLREQEFMHAQEATGMKNRRRIFRHLIPNVMPQLIVTATMGIGEVIIYESTLSYLGLGVKRPLATWGTMINSITDSSEAITRYAYIWIPVGVLICLTVIAFNFVGDGLRDAFDPKMKQ